jgi:hypothetical protein
MDHLGSKLLKNKIILKTFDYNREKGIEWAKRELTSVGILVLHKQKEPSTPVTKDLAILLSFSQRDA